MVTNLEVLADCQLADLVASPGIPTEWSAARGKMRDDDFQTHRRFEHQPLTSILCPSERGEVAEALDRDLDVSKRKRPPQIVK